MKDRRTSQRKLVEAAEKDGVLYYLAAQEEDIWADYYDSERARVGLKESAGALTGVDTEQLLADTRASWEQRRGGNRPS